MKITYTFNDTDTMLLSYIAIDEENYVKSAIEASLKRAEEEIISIVIKYCIDNNTNIPISKEEIIKYGFNNEIIKSAKEKQAEYEAQNPIVGA